MSTLFFTVTTVAIQPRLIDRLIILYCNITLMMLIRTRERYKYFSMNYFFIRCRMYVFSIDMINFQIYVHVINTN